MSNTQEPIAHSSCVLLNLAVESSSSIAIVDSSLKLTYEQLHQQADSIALHLRQHGIGPEKVVGLFLHRSASQVVAMLGILKAGAACLPLDTSEPPLRLKSILEDSNARLLITDYSLKTSLEDFQGDVLYIEDLQQPLEESQSTQRPAECAELYSDQLALLLYQSSPAGRPEAVRLTHLSLSDLAAAARLQMLPSDKVAYTSSPEQQSWLFEIVAPLALGATVVVLPDSSSLPPRKFASLLRDSQITILSTYSTALQRLTTEFPWAIKSVRMFVCNDIPADSTSLINKLKTDIQQRVFFCYEALEAASNWALQPLSLSATDAASQHMTISKESLTDSSIQPMGRRDGRIHHRGQTIYSKEIEAALLQHSSVSQAAVIFKDGAIAALIVAAPDQQPSSVELRQLLKKSIPETMLPSSFTFQESLPRTSDGDIDYKALVNQEADTLNQTAKSAVAPGNEIERQLAQIWMEVFEGQQPGVNDNFFSLGGSSLLATQVVARISDVFNVYVPLKQLFETPTIAGVAKIIEKLSTGQQINTEKQEDKEVAEQLGSCITH